VIIFFKPNGPLVLYKGQTSSHIESPNTKGDSLVEPIFITIKENIVEFYKDLYSESSICRPLLDGTEFSVLEDKMSCWMERCFSEDEVFEVVSNMNPLLYVPPWYGFGSRRRQWIFSCISTFHFSVLVVEALNQMLEKARI